ncbi:hypothetical protein EDEG_00974 [Edhazardia aedis USNM 41457]|uniref:Uncharacterized protein n=1 Tax=Edhazardia aedis (strain USNM 41457) TaxID=1003232 RepID=J9DU60_EDHAE|nr:hypothetical protein EDEG_00974 [Edhazardia aedis USNM 41457]|eukprot:EJW04837.1 hypothetical protein EDEG_00974 [Edhazardia aedis USNM 41457]
MNNQNKDEKKNYFYQEMAEYVNNNLNKIPGFKYFVDSFNNDAINMMLNNFKSISDSLNSLVTSNMQRSDENTDYSHNIIEVSVNSLVTLIEEEERYKLYKDKIKKIVEEIYTDIIENQTFVDEKIQNLKQILYDAHYENRGQSFTKTTENDRGNTLKIRFDIQKKRLYQVISEFFCEKYRNRWAAVNKYFGDLYFFMSKIEKDAAEAFCEQLDRQKASFVYMKFEETLKRELLFENISEIFNNFNSLKTPAQKIHLIFSIDIFIYEFFLYKCNMHLNEKKIKSKLIIEEIKREIEDAIQNCKGFQIFKKNNNPNNKNPITSDSISKNLSYDKYKGLIFDRTILYKIFVSILDKKYNEILWQEFYNLKYSHASNFLKSDIFDILNFINIIRERILMFNIRNFVIELSKKIPS